MSAMALLIMTEPLVPWNDSGFIARFIRTDDQAICAALVVAKHGRAAIGADFDGAVFRTSNVTFRTIGGRCLDF